ncbi:helix-turn-helix transcriptional regulator [Achromobacter ruhlandii]|uniref:helix-turn-helix transcriptional regulator n=1 Tax=Achromobacter ruhlandii TaxID=72557 RepID=UPI0006C2FF4E|nr:AraC family transcriptional regulator [Achromobacter ruhlandii]AVC43206.1 AraC family transcriptional regulator [Achromobacter xylosoxidans]CUI50911.1 transcriptional activator FtrA [Achromobacter ruhlandii]CUI64274.1 transcriptional activator FtrA [Achromobacter ruhlandii]CUK06398.1 transcriptional activator FtrA [Achromobacter ruhlandii]
MTRTPAESSVRSGHPLLPTVSIPTEWIALSRQEAFDEDLTLTAWNGAPAVGLDVDAEGPPMFCIAVFLDGHARMSIEGGEPLAVGPGMAVVQTGERGARGRFQMAGGQNVRLVDIRYSPAGLLRAGGRPLAALRGAFVLDHSVPAMGSLMAGFPAPPGLLRLAGDVLDCLHEDATARRLYMRAKALEALAIVLETMSDAAGEPPAAPRERRQLAQARRLIEARYGEEWTVSRLAREVGLSEKKLKAGFRQVAGRSVHAYLKSVRLDAAASMLEAGYSVTDAALATGFGNLSHFSKSFRQAKGVAPRHWLDRPGVRLR